MNTRGRTTGVMVEVLDLTDLCNRAVVRLQETDPSVTEVRIDTWAKATAPDGTLYLLCSEGVGTDTTEDDPIEIDIWKGDRTNEDGSTTFDMFPALSAKLPPSAVAKYPVSHSVDLADFIRSFGARLESNFWTWHRTLTEGLS